MVEEKLNVPLGGDFLRVLRTLRRWAEQRFDWWQMQDEAILLRVNTPVSNSKDEWAQSFLDLSKAVIEGFQTRPIRTLLRQEKIPFRQGRQNFVPVRKAPHIPSSR